MQIDPNSPAQAPLGSTLSEDVNAPVQRVSKRRNKKTARVKGIAEIADVTPAERVADGASAVVESTDMDAVIRRMRSGAYNTREVAEVIARRLLASGDL